MYRMPFVRRQSMSCAFCALPMYRKGATSVGGEEMMSSRSDAGRGGWSSTPVERCSVRRLSSTHGADDDEQLLSSPSCELHRRGYACRNCSKPPAVHRQVLGRPHCTIVRAKLGTLCRLSVVCLSVTFCIAAKRYVLAKSCLKERIGNHGSKS